MLRCTACMQRCLRTLFADISTTHPSPVSLDRSHPVQPGLNSARRRPLRRTYATDVSCCQPDMEILPSELISDPSSTRHGDNEPTESGGSPRAKDKSLQRLQRHYKAAHLERELGWVRDPLKLANKIVGLLQRDEVDDCEKALELVRQASKSTSCTVSWNHLIDYDMSKRRVKQAILKYNEMKKRAQTPDAHTYTTLFRGFSWNVHVPTVLEKTLSIYHSMFAEKSPVKPSITHTNAVLKVCALIGDLDAMYGVAARLPTRGRGSPDKLTFTIILNAIRKQSFEDTKGGNVNESLRENQKRAVMQGRRMWEEIRDRWSKGDLWVDEELVCAMGRLLLMGHTKQDYDDILSLLELTMGIPRQVSPLGLPDRPGDAFHTESKDQLQDSDDDGEQGREVFMRQPDHSPKLSHPEDTESEEPEPLDLEKTSPFAPLTRQLPDSLRVQPGVNTLSLALEACTALHLSRPAQDYWGLLTSPLHYNISPDRENYHVYLRLLRFQRASKIALEIVEEMNKGVLISPSAFRGEEGGEGKPQVKTFRIALSCCARDKNNRNALSYADRLATIMGESFETPDPKCLIHVLDIARSHRPQEWRTLMPIARNRVKDVRNLRSFLQYGWTPADKKQRAKAEEMKTLVKALIRKLIGMYDIFCALGREGMEKQVRREVMKERFWLAASLTRMNDGDKDKGNGEHPDLADERPWKTLPEGYEETSGRGWPRRG